MPCPASLSRFGVLPDIMPRWYAPMLNHPTSSPMMTRILGCFCCALAGCFALAASFATPGCFAMAGCFAGSFAITAKGGTDARTTNANETLMTDNCLKHFIETSFLAFLEWSVFPGRKQELKLEA